ncbi:biotin transporter BioY [Bifidobacterium criceti]|uniref:BioY family protein n=1 Tax=Bifidobacterium criceti TaxID=1960969 RepID=A0A2A2EFJ5_9BIFI|nr:biotin transporter BioY [Bifidobacterium criceti]PAU67722.1 BioY family protein [Bifidobacterium criceti]
MKSAMNPNNSLTIRTQKVTIRRVIGGGLPVALTAGALWAAAAIGRIAIPGTPVPITLQTLVLMIAAVTLDWKRVTSAVALYLTMGMCGLPVFSGGMSTAALVGPTCGFLYAFLPAGVVTATLAATLTRGVRGVCGGRGVHGVQSDGMRADSAQLHASVEPDNRARGGRAGGVLTSALMFAAHLIACVLGCVLLQDCVGVLVQAAMTKVPLDALATASAAFIPGDLLKAALAASLATPIALAKQR